MKGKIKINNLAVECVIGVFEEERILPQKVLISAEIEVEFDGLAGEKSTARTVDWFELSGKIERFLVEKKFYLAEEAVRSIAEMILENEKALSAKVSLKKKLNFENRMDSFEAEVKLER